MDKLIQCNINRSPRAFDLLVQTMIESGIGIAAISEPPFVPDRTNWHSSGNKLATVYWRPRIINGVPALLFQSNNVVAVKLGEFNIVSCYISPNIPRGEFLEFMN